MLAGLEIGPRSDYISHSCTAKMEVKSKIELVHVADVMSIDWLTGYARKCASILMRTQRASSKFERFDHTIVVAI